MTQRGRSRSIRRPMFSPFIHAITFPSPATLIGAQVFNLKIEAALKPHTGTKNRSESLRRDRKMKFFRSVIINIILSVGTGIAPCRKPFDIAESAWTRDPPDGLGRIFPGEIRWSQGDNQTYVLENLENEQFKWLY
ncbi:hypothetical protein PCASD_22734, partial [Puccinia coronata f. sp. avenae]